MFILGSLITNLLLAVSLVLAAAVAGLMAYHYAKARLRERQGYVYDPDTATIEPDQAGMEQRAKSAEEIAQIRARIEALMEQQQLTAETQNQHLGQKLDEIRTHMGQQDIKMDGLKSELRHEIRRRDSELGELRQQLAAALDTFWKSMPLPEGHDSARALPEASHQELPDERPGPEIADDVPKALSEPGAHQNALEPETVNFATSAPERWETDQMSKVPSMPHVAGSVATFEPEPEARRSEQTAHDGAEGVTALVEPAPELDATDALHLAPPEEPPGEATFTPVTRSDTSASAAATFNEEHAAAPAPPAPEIAPAAPSPPPTPAPPSAIESEDIPTKPAPPQAPPIEEMPDAAFIPAPGAAGEVQLSAERDATGVGAEPDAEPASGTEAPEAQHAAGAPGTPAARTQDSQATPERTDVTSAEVMPPPRGAFTSPPDAAATPPAPTEKPPPPEFKIPVFAPIEPVAPLVSPPTNQSAEAARADEKPPQSLPPTDAPAESFGTTSAAWTTDAPETTSADDSDTPYLDDGTSAESSSVRQAPPLAPEPWDAVEGVATEDSTPETSKVEGGAVYSASDDAAAPALPRESTPRPVQERTPAPPAPAPLQAVLPQRDRPAAPPESSAPATQRTGDDLTVISSITDSIQEELYRQGVTTLDEMARWSRADARRISGLVGVAEETIMHQWIFEAQSVLFDSFQEKMARQKAAQQAG